MHVKNSRNDYIVHSIAFFPPTTIFLGCCCFLKFFAVILHFVCNCVSEKKEKCCGNRGEIWYNFILTTILIMFNIIKVLRKDITSNKLIILQWISTLEILGIFSGVTQSLYTPPSSYNDYSGANDDNGCDEDMCVCRPFLRVCICVCVSIEVYPYLVLV